MERTDSTAPTRVYFGDRSRDRSRRSCPTFDLRSESTIRRLAGVLSVLGLLVASYLSLESLTGTQGTCSLGGCERVLVSTYSSVRVGPVEVSLQWFAVIGYLTILTATLSGGDRARMAAFGLSTFGFGIFLFLFGLHLVVIRAFCPFCLASGLLMAFLFTATTVRLYMFFGADALTERAADPSAPICNDDKKEYRDQ